MVVWSKHGVAYFVMMFCSDAVPCVVTGVVGVLGNLTVSWGFVPASTLFALIRVGSVGGRAYFRTLCPG